MYVYHESVQHRRCLQAEVSYTGGQKVSGVERGKRLYVNDQFLGASQLREDADRTGGQRRAVSDGSRARCRQRVGHICQKTRRIRRADCRNGTFLLRLFHVARPGMSRWKRGLL